MKSAALYIPLVGMATILFPYAQVNADDAMHHSLTVAIHPTERSLGRITFVDPTAEPIFPFFYDVDPDYLNSLLTSREGGENPTKDLEQLADLASSRVFIGYELYPTFANVDFPLPCEAVLNRNNALALLTTRAQAALVYLSYEGSLHPQLASEYSGLLDNIMNTAQGAEQSIENALTTETQPGNLSTDEWHGTLIVDTAYHFEELLAQMADILNEAYAAIEPCSGVEYHEKDRQTDTTQIKTDLPMI